MSEYLTIFLGVIFTYLISSLIVFLVFARINRTTNEEMARLFFISIGFGPLVISWIMTKQLKFFPGHSDPFYLVTMLLFFLCLFILGLKKIKLLAHGWQAIKSLTLRKGQKEDMVTGIVAVMALAFVLLIFMSTIYFKYSDAIKYATSSKIIYENKSIESYPFIQADPVSGYQAYSAHPLGYHSLIVWSYIIQGNGDSAGLMKIISPVYAVYTLLLIWHLLSGRGRIYSAFGVLLLMASPIFFRESITHSIDPLRIYFFTISFVCIGEYLNSGRQKFLLVTGITAGFCMYAHSLNILVLPFISVVSFLKFNATLGVRLRHIVVVAIIATAIGGGQYISNYFETGSPITQSAPIYAIEKLDSCAFFNARRAFFSIWDRLVRGGLAGFLEPDLFGFSYWVFGLSMLFYKKIFNDDPFIMPFLWGIILFYCIIGMTIFNKDALNLGNYRYFLTCHLFIVYGGALFLGRVYEKINET